MLKIKSNTQWVDRAKETIRKGMDKLLKHNVYTNQVFQRHYKTKYLLVFNILKFVITHDVCFVQGKDLIGKMDLPLQKCMNFIKMFAYGVLTNAIGEYCLWKSKTMESLKKIILAISPLA
jgi:hypothetical protein